MSRFPDSPHIEQKRDGRRASILQALNDGSFVPAQQQDFTLLSPAEQGEVYKAIFQKTFSDGVRYTTKQIHRDKKESDPEQAEFQQFFELNKEAFPKITASKMSRALDAFNDFIERYKTSPESIEDQDEEIDLQTRFLFQNLGLDEHSTARTNLVRAIKNFHTSGEGDIPLESRIMNLFREAIEKNNDDLRSNFKIHLNPTPEALPLIAQRLGKLIVEVPELRDNLLGFKIPCRKDYTKDLERTDRMEWDHIAPVIIYVRPGENAQKTMEIVSNICRKILTDMNDLESYTLPDSFVPRYNVPISLLLHLAQSDGDFKNRLYKMKYRDGRSMLDDVMDEELNHAVCKEDSQWMDELLRSLQTDKAKAWMANFKKQLIGVRKIKDL